MKRTSFVRLSALLIAAMLAVGGSGCAPHKEGSVNENTLETIGYYAFRPLSETQMDYFRAADRPGGRAGGTRRAAL